MTKIAASLTMLFLISCSSNHERHRSHSYPLKALAEISSASTKASGTVHIEETKDEVIFTISMKGLPSRSTHGMHIHENGVCEGPGYQTAGGHFNPHNTQHGGPDDSERHIGDFGNLETDKNGNAKKVIKFRKDDHAVLDLIKEKAIIVHAKADDLKTQPSGNSGDRIACGLIKLK
jgi:Cu-Zn family superoxide dismutase